ncbi:Short-chain dehydrogenase/reductase family protein [Mycena indigotica]|uniref:Short-chain dehydrogenase/reductase family protein n=1 Tax=Mycena indigotica TaxID=2126181 RepID=A0A8H6S205_9AGAR|nr:Short-chain dehydrogenase/reductase family protein [Mycena indigotica]KAF7290576.1 Short-chain dehydrogenase/reductase family protein [Mycena indigotica]
MSLPTFSFETTAQEAASALREQISGKNVLITGTSTKSLGLEAARAMAPYANLIIITGYNAERLKASEQALKKEFPSANIRPLTLDLSSLASVRRAAAEVNAYSEPLHVLIHNAATLGSYYVTEDDFEIQVATAQFGPFLFTKLVTQKLLLARSPSYTPRVVFVSSSGHQGVKEMNFSNLRYGYPGDDAGTADVLMHRYAEVKSANILMGIEISRRSKGQLRGYSLHPGMIATNAVDKEALWPVFRRLDVVTSDMKPKDSDNGLAKWKTLPQGATTTVVAAFDPRLDDKAGAYLVDGNIAAKDQVAPHAVDITNAETLWNLTEEILGEKYEFA